MLVALIISCALFMENLDATVLATALPAMGESLGVSPIHLSLAITAYILSLAVFIPISGWVADRFGSSRVFRAAIVLFTLGSIACGLSQSLPQLALARLLQGVGGAMMVPVGRLVLLRTVPKDQLVRAMNYLTTPAMVGPLIGPPIGGLLTTYLSWRWIFFINIPIGLLGLYLSWRYIADHREEAVAKLDGWGFVNSGVALAALMAGFESIGRDGVDWRVAPSLLALGVLVGIVAVRHSRRHPHPLVDLDLLKTATFRISVLGGSLFRICMGAIPFLLPLMLQVGFGMTAFVSGLLTFATAAGALVMKMTAGPILRRYGFRQALVINSVLSALLTGAIGLFRPDTPVPLILLVLLVGGFFRSLQFTGLNTLAFADVPAARMSAATSLSSMVQQVSLGMGVATGALLLHTTLALHGGAQLVPHDFMVAFLTVMVIGLASFLFFIRLDPDAGAEVSGHHSHPLRPATEHAAGDD
ncbi:DHA2 family efflux MFS transporter permease subunit [Nitrospirillum amazonense]|uniref:EmrB/QacA subfamily drug resistance transporter n=1 Tax=Nitrospirillum amazonense TaxID=28077 RepID=A0A560KAK1_9PROT|nr:DHA2 family efflux MFS transporter permease subunit [Nitrospirillum amazonense]MDG3441449.1 DHA2 family efflux MFS transporter permease subunit [Nitrospirillum amazonense]TWB80059.1 EmrB/QacA subfamily drug resistance transporter [Nitrospirillum amazonense]